MLGGIGMAWRMYGAEQGCLGMTWKVAKGRV